MTALCIYALQSGQTTAPSSTRNPRPTKLELHLLQLKHSECQFLSSKVINLQPPNPEKILISINNYGLIECLAHVCYLAMHIVKPGKRYSGLLLFH